MSEEFLVGLDYDGQYENNKWVSGSKVSGACVDACDEAHLKPSESDGFYELDRICHNSYHYDEWAKPTWTKGENG